MSAHNDNDEPAACAHCANCRNLGVEVRSAGSLHIQCDSESLQSKCQRWLEKCTISSDGESVYSSESCETNGASVSETTEDDSQEFSNEVQCFSDQVVSAQNAEGADIVHKIFGQGNVYGNVHVKKSRKVRVGNVTNIYGPVYITQAVSMVNQRSVTNQLIVNLPAPVKHGELSLVSRKNWQALAPVEERTLLEGPAKFVIISHTVSEPRDNTQASNTDLVQSVQRYHLTKCNFDDIAYNFLIGSDGNVYEGRGWSVVGSHTYRYNRFSVGISFMGYFCENLPSDESLRQARILIQRGVELGAIDENYKLLAHCQCSGTESPGERLYIEIQKWDRWDSGIDVHHPSPLVVIR